MRVLRRAAERAALVTGPGWTEAELRGRVCRYCGAVMVPHSPNGVDMIWECPADYHDRVLVTPAGEAVTLRPRAYPPRGDPQCCGNGEEGSE